MHLHEPRARKTTISGEDNESLIKQNSHGRTGCASTLPLQKTLNTFDPF